MKQISIMTLLLMACLMGACSSDDYEAEMTVVTNSTSDGETDGALSVSDITRSECLNNMTRGVEDGLRTTKLVLRRDGNTIDCQLLDVQAQCSLDFYADAKYDSDGTLVITIGDQSDVQADCMCYYNAAFHVDHATFKQCRLRVQWNEPGWTNPYTMYEGDVTIGDGNTVIIIR